MKTFSALLVACLFIAAAHSALARPAQAINGQVLDLQGGIPIAGATVQVLGTKLGAVSRNDGKFTILNVDGSKVQLRISSIGYRTDTVDVDLSLNEFIVVKLVGSVVDKGEVIVLGSSAKGQARALSQQKTNANVTNIVSSDLIGRFPDQNIGDAMKRIPGIAVQYDQGEARFGLIRGTPGQLNSVMINGERIPSAEAEIRQVQLDLVPSEMVRAIEVNKTLTPDMDADAIGGAVNLVTRDAATEPRVSATLGSGYNFLAEKPMVVGSFTAGTRLANDAFGVVLSGSYYDHNLGSDNIEGAWAEDDNGNAWLEEFEVRTYNIQRIRRSISAGLDYRFDAGNVLRLNAIYNNRDDWENRYAVNYAWSNPGDSAAEIQRETKGGSDAPGVDGARAEYQQTYNVTLSGEHTIADVVRLTWNGTMAYASEEKRDERYIAYINEEAQATVNITDPSQPNVNVIDGDDPSQMEFDGLSQERGFTTDADINGRLDVSFPWLTGDFSNIVKAGGRIRTKAKERDNNYFEYEATDGSLDEMATQNLVDKTIENFLAGPYRAGQFVSKDGLGSYDVSNSSVFESSDEPEEYVPGNFTADESIVGGYVMLDQSIGSTLQAIIGVRFESTSNSYKGNIYDVDEGTFTSAENTTSYTNILPSVNLRWAATDDLIVRGAWTNGIARPNYFDLVPYRIVSNEDSEISEGNSNLKPTTSMNVDLMAEYYMEPIGIVSGGLFYKSLSDFIFNYTQNDYLDPISQQTFDTYTQPRNLASANILGFEVQLQRQLDMLPGALSGLGIYLNYTYASSSVDGLPLEGRENEDLRLSGNPQHSANASLSYEYSGLMIRVALNYTSDYIDEYGDGAFYDRYYDAQTFVDANASFAITPNFRIFVDANNLTNQPLRYYQGVQERVAQAEFYNARFQAGVKYDM